MAGELSQTEYLRHQVWVLLHHVNDMIVKCEEDSFYRKAGITYQQFLILLSVESMRGPATAAEVGRQLQRNPNTVTMIVDRMERLKLVKRVRSRKDRRLVYVHVTPLGQERLSAALAVGTELVQRVAGEFSEAELRLFSVLLEKLGQEAARESRSKESPAEIVTRNMQGAARIFAEGLGRNGSFDKPTTNG